MIIRREVIDSDNFAHFDELSRLISKAVIIDVHSLIVSIEDIEAFGN